MATAQATFPLTSCIAFSEASQSFLVSLAMFAQAIIMILL